MNVNSNDIEVLGTPKILVTRSIDGSTGTATFVFNNKDLFEQLQSRDSKFHKINLTYKNETILSHSLKVNFKNGHPDSLNVLFILKNLKEWEIFNQFMKFYSKKKNLGFDNFDQEMS
jgi:photosystem II reaction center protein Psb28